jgi:hypothetical protein
LVKLGRVEKTKEVDNERERKRQTKEQGRN